MRWYRRAAVPLLVGAFGAALPGARAGRRRQRQRQPELDRLRRPVPDPAVRGRQAGAGALGRRRARPQAAGCSTQWKHLLVPVVPGRRLLLSAWSWLGNDLGTAMVLFAIAARRAVGRRRAARLFALLGGGRRDRRSLLLSVTAPHRLDRLQSWLQPRRRLPSAPAGRRCTARSRSAAAAGGASGIGASQREVGRPARGAHRLHLRRHRRGARPGRHAARCSRCSPCSPTPGIRVALRTEDPFVRLRGRRHRGLDHRAGDDQHRRGARPAADHRHPAAAGLLRRLGAAAHAGRARACSSAFARRRARARAAALRRARAGAARARRSVRADDGAGRGVDGRRDCASCSPAAAPPGHLEPAARHWPTPCAAATRPSRSPCLGTARGLETRLVPERGYPLELIPPVPAAAPAVHGPAVAAGPAARPRSGPPSAVLDRTQRGRRRRLRRLRRRRRPTSRPGAGSAVRRPRGERACRAWPTGSARASPRTSRPAVARTRAAARARTSGMPLRRDDRRRSTGPRRAPRRGRRFGLDPDRPTLLVIRRLAGRPADQPGGGRRGRGAWPTPASRCCTSSGPQGRGRPRAGDRRCAAVRRARYVRPDGPRLRRRRPGAVPGRRRHRRRAGRGRAARASSCRCRSATASSALNAAAGGRRRRRAAGRRRGAARPAWVRRARRAAAARPATGWRRWVGPPRRLVARDADEQLAPDRPGRRRTERGMSRVTDGGCPAAPSELGRVHFVGIGGAGMSGIARIMLARGVAVSRQRRQGLPRPGGAARARRRRATSGTRAEQVGDADTVVVSTAVRDDNPEVRRGAPRAGCGCCRAAGRSQSVMAGRRGGRGRRHPRQDHDHLAAHRRRCSTAAPTRRSPSAATSTTPASTPTTAPATCSSPRPTRATASFLLYSPVRRDRDQRRGRPPRPLRHGGGRTTRPSTPSRRRIDPDGFLVACADDPGARPAGRDAPRLGGLARARRTASRPDADVRVERLAAARHRVRRSTSSRAARRLGSGRPADPGTAQRPQRRRRAGRRARARAARGACCARVWAVHRHPAPVRAQGRGRRRARLRRLRPPPDRDRRGACARPATVAGGGRLVVAFQPHRYTRTAAFRQRVRRRARRWPTRSWSSRSTRRGRTRSPARPGPASPPPSRCRRSTSRSSRRGRPSPGGWPTLARPGRPRADPRRRRRDDDRARGRRPARPPGSRVSAGPTRVRARPRSQHRSRRHRRSGRPRRVGRRTTDPTVPAAQRRRSALRERRLRAGSSSPYRSSWCCCS